MQKTLLVEIPHNYICVFSILARGNIFSLKMREIYLGGFLEVRAIASLMFFFEKILKIGFAAEAISFLAEEMKQSGEKIQFFLNNNIKTPEIVVGYAREKKQLF